MSATPSLQNIPSAWAAFWSQRYLLCTMRSYDLMTENNTYRILPFQPCVITQLKGSLGHLSLPQNTTLIHQIDDTLMTGSSEQEVAATLDLLVMHMHIIGWEINPSKIEGPSTSVKFSGAQWCEACRDIPFKVKDNYCTQALPPPRKNTELSGPAWILETHIPHLGNVTITMPALSGAWRRSEPT